MGLRGILASLTLGAVAMVAPAKAGEAPLLQAGDRASLGRLTLGEFAPGTLDRGAIESQTPVLRVPITDIAVTVIAGAESECKTGFDWASALAKPNAGASGGDTDSCLFLARLAVGSARGTLTTTSECDDWLEDVSECWVDGGVGQFWLRRRADNPRVLQLILGRFGELAQPVVIVSPAQPLPPPPAPKRGIMLDSVFDDAGRAISDRWLLLPPGVVTLRLER